MRRAEIRREIIVYLNKFYSDFMLWSADMYEQLTESQKISLYLKLIKKKLN